MNTADDAEQLAGSLATISRAVQQATAAAGRLAAADPHLGRSAAGLALVFELQQLTAAGRLAGLVNPWNPTARRAAA